MGALFLNVRHRILGDAEMFRGTLHRAEVEPREILKECLLRGAAGVVVFHTHPSGDPTPSDADLQFTRRMAYAAALVGVDLVDHLVLGAIGRWVSLKAQGGMVRRARSSGRGAAGDAHTTGGNFRGLWRHRRLRVLPSRRNSLLSNSTPSSSLPSRMDLSPSSTWCGSREAR
jgi:hypothetical protein